MNACQVITVYDWAATGAMVGAIGAIVAGGAGIGAVYYTRKFYSRLVANDDRRLAIETAKADEEAADRQRARIKEISIERVARFQLISKATDTRLERAISSFNSNVADEMILIGREHPDDRHAIVDGYIKWREAHSVYGRDHLYELLEELELKDPGKWSAP